MNSPRMPAKLHFCRKICLTFTHRIEKYLLPLEKRLFHYIGPLIPEAEALKTEALIVSSVIEISVCVCVCLSVCLSVRPLEVRVFDLGT